MPTIGLAVARRGHKAAALLERWPPEPARQDLVIAHVGDPPRWLTVDGGRFQSYRADTHRTPLISDDGRIRIEQHGDFWIAHVDGAEVIDCGLIRRFDNEEEAIRAALAQLL